MDSEGHLALLASQIKHADFLKGADIYIDGFENFTTREYEIITELMKYGRIGSRLFYRWNQIYPAMQIMSCFLIQFGLLFIYVILRVQNLLK